MPLPAGNGGIIEILSFIMISDDRRRKVGTSTELIIISANNKLPSSEDQIHIYISVAIVK